MYFILYSHYKSEGASKQSSDLKNYTAPPGSKIPGSATEGISFREQWGKCSMPCIIKFYFVTFTSWILTFDYAYFLVINNTFMKNIENCLIALFFPC